MLDVAAVEPGQTVDARLAVRASRGLKPYADGYLVRVTLGNANGSLPAKVWMGPDEERARAVADRLAVGTVVEVHARASEYRGRVELSLEEPPATVPDEEVDAARFVPGSDRHLGRLLLDVLERARAIDDPGLRGLVLEPWTDEALQERIVQAPATKSHHRARRGGLLERVHALLDLAEALGQAHPGLDGDLLAAAVLLAPLGSLDEHAVGPSIEITDEGRLVGPVVLADQRLRERLEAAELAPERALRLRHAVLAHRGRGDASPVAPRTPEAVALSAIEDADARVARTHEAAERMRREDEVAGWARETNAYLDLRGRAGEPAGDEAQTVEPAALPGGTNGS